MNEEDLFDGSIEAIDQEGLHDDEESKYSSLSRLSGLSGEDADRFRETWRSMSLEVRRDIPRRLVELCEDDVELDFSTVFCECIDDDDADVRELGVQGLWEFEDRTIIRKFIGLLSADPSYKVRSAAAVGLGRFASMAQDGKLLVSESDRVRDALLSSAAGSDEHYEVRRRAMEAVSYFDTLRITDMIREAYSSEDVELKRSAIISMGQSSNPTWLPTVVSDIYHELSTIRYEAAVACGLLGDDFSVSHLIVLLKDEDLEVQQAAVRALGLIGGPQAKHALNGCLEMDDEVIQQLAQESLDMLAFDDNPLGVGYDS